jgi:RHS repeat-associated protein
MLSDGANTLSWNARNQVAMLNSASLQYDGFGRRTKNLQNTWFLFDGANAAQELSGSSVTANLISGGIDEIFTRGDSTGTFTPLQDALGSTIALVNASGGLVTQYAYDPFGNSTVTGASNSNAFQYTGRENEGNGLYFYRARYYSPVLGRFVNQDPLGFAGSGPNFYEYVSDSPVNLRDPSGLCNDPGGGGIRYCVQAFIPDTHVGLTGFQGDGRGPQSDGGTFRFGQDVFNVPVSNTIDSYAGISHFGPFGVPAHIAYCEGRERVLPHLHGRKIHLRCAGSDGWFFGAAPNAAYDITITESPSGISVIGSATQYPSIEVWQYGGPNGPRLLFSQDASSEWFTELPIATQQTITPTFTPWR